MKLQNETIKYDLESKFENDYMQVAHCKQKAALICIIRNSYVPIEVFVTNFTSMYDIVKDCRIKKVIFDKRNLTAFHQPTMEWYYVEWKENLRKLGVHIHRKLLPNEAWFKRCVEAGKNQILNDNPQFDVSQYDIKYFESIQECLDN